LLTCRLCSLGSSAVFADQAVDGLPALDPGGHIDGVAALVQRRSLAQRLVRPVAIVMSRVLSQHLPEMPLVENQQVIKALAAKRAHESLRK
jgi:hypothetical protein